MKLCHKKALSNYLAIVVALLIAMAILVITVQWLSNTSSKATATTRDIMTLVKGMKEGTGNVIAKESPEDDGNG